jgi:hypothetical protein
MIDRPERCQNPFRLNLEQQNHRAEDLCRALKAGDPLAIGRLRASDSRVGDGIDRDAGRVRGGLADAQLVVAREAGLSSWPKLKAHIRSMERERAGISQQKAAPDGDRRTLHIRCGRDIAQTLVDAGFTGDFLEYSDPVCQGPVTGDPDLTALRAQFLADAYGKAGNFSFPDTLDKLRRGESGLAKAAEDYERVVLWFEHDTYDQLILVRCLAHFAAAGVPRVLELVSVNHFPGTARFIGLGQLPAEALRLLWGKRHRVSPAQLALGRTTWDALKSPDPSGLVTIQRTENSVLTDLPRALLRHFQELPSVRTGLGLTELLLLGALSEGSRTIGQVFHLLMTEREPLPWLGDLMFLAIVEAMGRAAEPAFEMAPDSLAQDWPRRRLTLTRTGRQVLAGERDWLSLDPPGAVGRWYPHKAGCSRLAVERSRAGGSHDLTTRGFDALAREPEKRPRSPPVAPRSAVCRSLRATGQ